MHDIFNAMYEGEKCWFYWIIHIHTKDRGELLRIVACLINDVHETANPVIE